MCTPYSRRVSEKPLLSRIRGPTVPAGLPMAQVLGGGDGTGCWAGAELAWLPEPLRADAKAGGIALPVPGAAISGGTRGLEPLSRSVFLSKWELVAVGAMGQAFSGPLTAVSPLELYNRLQDSRDQLLVADAGAKWHEEAEFAIIRPEQMKELLQELATRRARGFTVAAMSTSSLRELKAWMRAEGLGPGADCLVKDLMLVSGGAPSFYSSFPFLHVDHEFYELGRLYPSLIATEGGTRLFLSNFGVASDPHTYHALGIKFVVNCTRDLPFVDEVVAILRQRKASEEAVKPINLEAWMQ